MLSPAEMSAFSGAEGKAPAIESTSRRIRIYFIFAAIGVCVLIAIAYLPRLVGWYMKRGVVPNKNSPAAVAAVHRPAATQPVVAAPAVVSVAAPLARWRCVFIADGLARLEDEDGLSAWVRPGGMFDSYRVVSIGVQGVQFAPVVGRGAPILVGFSGMVGPTNGAQGLRPGAARAYGAALGGGVGPSSGAVPRRGRENR